jgi:Uma2 family endonuclease
VGVAVTYIDDRIELRVPAGITDLESFRCWADADDFPENVRIDFLQGDVWVDLSRQDLFTHVAVKGTFIVVLGGLARSGSTGLFLGSGPYLSNVAAGMAVRPDALFVSIDSLQERVRLLDRKGEGYDELEGSPDMVLEVIGRGSAHRDKVLLRRAYWEAGVREYWLVDARPDRPEFDVLRHTARGYRATPKKGGWVASAVFGKSFCLTRQISALGHPEYTLAVR